MASVIHWVTYLPQLSKDVGVFHELAAQTEGRRRKQWHTSVARLNDLLKPVLYNGKNMANVMI
jgi:hypothetical protein